MKFTITRINRQNKLMVSTKTVDSFLERIAKDDAKQSVARFRMSVPLMEGDYQYYKGIREWQHVYPAAEFSKDESGNLVFQKSNGLVILHFTNLMTNQEKDAAKTAASLLPMTFAAIEGADGRSLIVLVSICNKEGKIPTKEEEADLLYQSAYEQVKTLYQAQVHATIKPEKPSLESNFMLTMDASPYYNNKAVAMRIASNQFAVATAPKSIDDLKAYEDYEFLYRKASEETMTEMKKANISWKNDNDRFLASLSAIASKLCAMGLNEEETFVHIRRNNWSKVAEEQLRQIVGTAYDSHSKDKRVEKSASARKGRADILQMINYLESRYQFRYNTVMKYTEYRPNNSWIGDFKPVDARVQKSMTLAVQIADIHVSIKDVRNFLESDRIRNYSPIESYLYDCLGKWDGKDRIRALARTVPTNNPHWEDWFYTWFLGMVDQWRGVYRKQYGNSTMPLLISKQGYNKSTFCRRLIPAELSWGFTDNMILSEKRQVLQAMSQFLLINLDEFNQISPQVQQGFLKNLLQLPTVKIKPPYGSHVEEFPRLASFIATSNMNDILTDPSGNRRFIGIELTGPIDVSVRPNHQQLFAQALVALGNGEKCYFDAEQVKLIMQSNCQFEVVQPIDQYFRLYFEPADDEKEGEYMTAAEIFDFLKKQIGSSLKVNSLMGFGRKLANMTQLNHKRFADGMKYLVKKR